GEVLLRRQGAARLSVREVAAKAGVNLGMFIYHFGNKNEFIRQILQRIYAEFLEDLERMAGEKGLEAVLFRMAVFSRDNSRVILALLGDVLSREKTVLTFLKKNFTAHFSVLRGAIERHCHQKDLPLRDPDHAFRYLVGAAGIPNLLLAAIPPSIRPTPDSDESLRKRVKAAIAGLEVLLDGRFPAA
ncbi:MAG: TetR/AcrR family transcriptional regulator, partial [Bdellovibrionales bacterium]|nr:TetR/AcrR family transcriptional regulator [Bdellovibrionales bacterium]